MLNFLRNAAKTWVFKGLFALLVVSFAIWGIGDVSIGGAGNRVATVGDEEISVEDYALALQREIQSLSRQLGRRITMEEAEAAGVPQNLLGRLARDAALNGEAARLGISAPDAAVRKAILSSPSFQGMDGSFDKQQYEFVLQQLGFDVTRFENDMRRALAREIIARGIGGAARAMPGYAETQLAHRLEQRELTILPIPAAALDGQAAAPDEATLRAWFRERADAYVAPERRDVSYIALDPASMIDQVEISEDDLRDAYEAAADRYDRPETRAVDRIAFPDTAAALAAKSAIESGEKTFADVVAELDLTLDDVSLGSVTRDDLATETADAAFDGGLGVKGPVATGLGPALVNVRAIVPASKTPFEDARDELKRELALSEAADLASRRAEEVADLIAGGATLEEIAAELNLPLSRATGVTLTGEGQTGIAANPDFIAEAFAADPGEERDMIPLPGGAWVALRVDDVAESAPLTFEQARDRVLADWTAERRRQALREKAEAVAAALNAGAAIADVAAEHGLTPRPTGPVTRDAKLPDAPASLIAELFAAKTAGAALAAVEGDVAAVGVVDAIKPADLNDPTYAQIVERWRAALNESVGRDLYSYYAQAIQNRDGATVNEAAMRQVINQLR